MDRSAPPQHYPFDNRYRLDRDRPPSVEHRDRDRDNDRQYEHPRHLDTGLRDPPRNSPYGSRPNEPWGRQSAEYRAPMDHSRPPTHDYPPASNPYSHSQYQTAPGDRYSSGGYGGPPQYETQDRAQFERLHPGPPPPRPRIGEEPQPAPTSSGYPTSAPYDPTRQRQEDPGAPHQRNIAAVQDMNRKGRMSPLPQAVQGAQSQQPGPATEPGIKSEFGRMFAGIGSGVGPSSPVASAAHPYTGAGSKELDDKGRRRKKDEEARDDDSSGRVTPLDGRGAKRPKAHHHHQYVPVQEYRIPNANYQRSHHHHHHHHTPDSVSSPLVGITPLKNVKGSDTEGHSGHHHHHHHHHASKPMQHSLSQQVTVPPVIPAKTKTIINSKAVMDAVAEKPRHHLGDCIYEPNLKAGRLLPSKPTHRGFESNPKPLPLELIKGKENCTLTVKVPRVHLGQLALEEITARSFLWGTDIYSDDSDVVAACIHAGWIKGQWTEDVDMTMLALHDDDAKKDKPKAAAGGAAALKVNAVISAPLETGPMDVLPSCDLHVTVLILPRLVKYSGMTRNGMTSRDFGGAFGSRNVTHDGLSYMVHSVQWVENGGQPQGRLRGKGRRERMRRAMVESKGLGNVEAPLSWKLEKREPLHVPEKKDDADKENAPAEAASDAPKTDEVQPAEVKAEEPKPVEDKAEGGEEPKPAEDKAENEEPKPVEGKAEDKPAEAEPAADKPEEPKPVEDKPEDPKPVEAKPQEEKPQEGKPTEKEDVEMGEAPAEDKPAEEPAEAEKPAEPEPKQGDEK